MAAAGGIPLTVLRRIVREMTSTTEPLGLAKAGEALGGPSEVWWTVESGLEGDGYRKFSVEIEGPPVYESMMSEEGLPRPSPYRGCWFKFQLEFTASYPHDCPKVSLLTPTYHTHVGPDGLKMCATYIPEAWGTLPVEKRSIFELFKLLRSFFASPSGDHAVNGEASKQLLEDVDGYDAKAREMAGGDDGEEDDDDDDDDEE